MFVIFYINAKYLFGCKIDKWFYESNKEPLLISLKLGSDSLYYFSVTSGYIFMFSAVNLTSAKPPLTKAEFSFVEYQSLLHALLYVGVVLQFRLGRR